MPFLVCQHGEVTTNPVLDIQGPVRGELFVIFEDEGEIYLTGPEGPRPWKIETHGRENPMEEIRRVASGLVADLLLLHSTSWRWEGSAVVLTFIAAVPKGKSEARRLSGSRDLARGSATAAPATIDPDQVLHHALRHLAWLAREDVAIGSALSEGWNQALSKYVPATFQQIE